MKVKRESEVAQLCPTLSDPMDCSLPGSSVHGIFQARVLGWGAIAFSKIQTTYIMLGLIAQGVRILILIALIIIVEERGENKGGKGRRRKKKVGRGGFG